MKADRRLAYGNMPADRDLLDLAGIAIRARPQRHLYAMTSPADLKDA